MRFLDKEGNYKWHLNLAAPVKDEAENIKMWVGVANDTTPKAHAFAIRTYLDTKLKWQMSWQSNAPKIFNTYFQYQLGQ